MSLTTNTSRLTIIKVANAILSIIAIAVFTNELGAAGVGVFFLFQAVLGFLSIPADFGFQGALLKRISEEGDPPDADLLTTGAFIIGILVLFTSTVVAVAAPFLNNYFGQALAFYLIPAIIANEAGKLTRNLLKSELRYHSATIAEAIRGVTFSVVGIVAVFNGGGPANLVGSLILSYTLMATYSAWRASTPLGMVSTEAALSLWTYAKYSVVAFLDSLAYKWLDVIVIGAFLSPAAVGIYEVAWRVSKFVMLPTRSIEEFMLPQTSNWDTSGRREIIESTLPNALFASAFFIFPTLFGAVIVGDELLSTIFGSEFGAGALVLLVLLFGRLVDATDGVLKTVIAGIDRMDLRARAVVVSLVSNIVLNVLLVPRYGIEGGAVATVLSFGVSTALIGVYLHRELSLRLPFTRYAWCVFASGIMLFALYFGSLFISYQGVWTLIPAILVGGLIYIAVILLHPPTRGEIRQLVADIR